MIQRFPYLRFWESQLSRFLSPFFFLKDSALSFQNCGIPVCNILDFLLRNFTRAPYTFLSDFSFVYTKHLISLLGKFTGILISHFVYLEFSPFPSTSSHNHMLPPPSIQPCPRFQSLTSQTPWIPLYLSICIAPLKSKSPSFLIQTTRRAFKLLLSTDLPPYPFSSKQQKQNFKIIINI